MSNSVWPHRWQPTRLRRPWDSPGKNTGVGCHFLLQCMKVKSESEVTQSCPTLSDPIDCNLPGSSIHGIFQARVLERSAIAFSDSWWQKTKVIELFDGEMSVSQPARGQRYSLQKLKTPTYFLYNLLRVIFYFSEQYCNHCFKWINSQIIILFHPSIIL